MGGNIGREEKGEGRGTRKGIKKGKEWEAEHSQKFSKVGAPWWDQTVPNLSEIEQIRGGVIAIQMCPIWSASAIFGLIGSGFSQFSELGGLIVHRVSNFNIIGQSMSGLG